MAQRAITMGGAPEGFDARLILNELEKSGEPVLHIARDDKRMEAMRAALAFFAPDMPVIIFPGSAASKSAITPSLSGLTALILPGVLPSINFASSPTAIGTPSSRSIATTEGSCKTTPLPDT